jgi:hypothetical protein
MPFNALCTRKTNQKTGRKTKTADHADEIIIKISSHRKHHASPGSLNADENATPTESSYDSLLSLVRERAEPNAK